ncbi:hypothetical protein [Rhizobium leguminosarum]|uniref:hypothetical protein n=1 Tax=Rhizobium leguminosarum TaxID=384 RepID=UPI00102F4292|nr:hypothetical protein [Rhizobium leguminosarum]TBG96065.1 hypothetical protein ELG68_36015 [Rhizobium leguminosarum]
MISVFYQAEGLRDIGHIEVEPAITIAQLKEQLAKLLMLDGELVLFIEDDEEPLGGGVIIKDVASAHGLKVHAHRCKEIAVAVTFNRKIARRTFKPGTTVAKVKKWAAIKEFGMTPDEAGEHLLQIVGTHDRPAPNTHLGTLVTHPHCQIGFDLVPDERVNGAPEAV